jgi:hypothetical protein
VRVHLSVGFQIIHTFQDEFQEWHIVLWDLRNKGTGPEKLSRNVKI